MTGYTGLMYNFPFFPVFLKVSLSIEVLSRKHFYLIHLNSSLSYKQHWKKPSSVEKSLCSEDHICRHMLSVILDHSNKTNLPKKYGIFLSLSEISTLQERSSWKARLSYLNPKALKIHGFYVIRGQKHWINVKSSNSEN